MTSAVLQMIALVTMTVDHIGYRLFPGADILRIIGRLSFPLFVFMLVEGFTHTRGRWKYLGRLALFALLSEVPYKIFTKGAYWWVYMLADPWSNVFYELMLIFIAIWSVHLAKEKNKLFFIITALCIAVAGFMGTMYGVYGILMGICFYIFRGKPWLITVCLAVLTGLYCLQHWSFFQMYAIAAAVPIYFYNGQRGERLPKYFAYIFYPAHLLVISGMYSLLA